MPFGPTAACPHFQRVVDIILIGVEDRVSGYVDNILVFSITFEQHIDDCQEVLWRLTAAGMRIKPAKTKYTFKKICFLGSIINGTSRYVDQEKIDKFITLRALETQRQLQAFLGFINYLQDFIPAYSHVVGPIKELRGVKSVKKAWGVKQVETIKLIQKILSNAPVLEHPNWDRLFMVATDASQFGIGAVLYQKDKDDKMHIIHLHAQSFTKGQKNYPAMKHELLAMIAPLKKWRHILMGRKFTIEVDHKALEYIHSSTQYMVLEWLDFLLNFDFTVTYKKGIDHVLPDYLSRLYEKPLEEGNNEVKKGEILFSAANLEADELAPEKTKQFMENFLKNRANKKLVTDPEERATLITNCHQESHQGGVGMFHKLFQNGFWWEDMLKDCMSTAKTCIDCLRYNTGRVGFHPLKPVTVTLPMDHVVWDLADMRRSEKGFKFILILVDVATKFVFL